MPPNANALRWRRRHEAPLRPEPFSTTGEPALRSVFRPTHVSNLGLAHAQDSEVWEHARDNDYIIVSKDADFSEMSVLRGFPPKVIWIRRGNCSTQAVEEILRRDYPMVETMVQNANIGILLLY